MESPFTLFDHTSVNNDSPVFELDGQHTVVAVGMQPGDTIAVTVEPAGGSPSGAPTTAPIIAIPTV